MEFLVGLDTWNCKSICCNVMDSVMPEDAEEAATKLNSQEFFGKVVTVKVAKPKKRGILFYVGIRIRKGRVSEGKAVDKAKFE